MKQIITIGYLNKPLWGGHIQPREQDFVISEEGISMSLPASYNLHCFKIMEMVRYAESSHGKESTLILGADSNGTHPQPSAIQALKTCQKH